MDDEPAELSNIRVVVRVRPAQDKTKTEAVTCGQQLEVDCGDGKRFTGAFEDILGPSSTQADVYRKVEDVVLQTTEGVNGCVMSVRPDRGRQDAYDARRERRHHSEGLERAL